MRHHEIYHPKRPGLFVAGLSSLVVVIVFMLVSGHRGSRDSGSGTASAVRTARHAPATRVAAGVPAGVAAGFSLQGAERTAGSFARTWWSYDWRNPPGSVAGRLAPYTSPLLDRLLGAPSPAPAMDAADRAMERTAVVATPTVTVEDESAAGIGLAVTAPVTVQNGAGARVTGLWAMEVLMTPEGNRWVVSEVHQ